MLTKEMELRKGGSMVNSTLKAALIYCEQGHSVIPVQKDKKPFLSWVEFQRRRATQDEIRTWWKRWPDANVGIVTGQISGLCVIDIDTPEGREAIEEYLPDAVAIPTAQTPRGGQHLYFTAPEEPLGNNAGTIPGCDFRGEGGYIVAPPSVNGNGRGYEWLPGLSLAEVEPPALSASYQASIKLISTKTLSIEGCRQFVDTPAEMFTFGRRDDDLFHTAHYLVRGRMPEAEIYQVLEKLILSWGETPNPKWIKEKISSAMKRAERRETNLAQDVREWVLSTTGVFLSTEICKGLQLSTREESKNLSIILRRLREEGLIERAGDKNGSFRRVENDCEPIQWETAAKEPFKIALPLGLSDLVNVLPRNLIVIAGAPDAGKTALMLNIVEMNLPNHAGNIHYFSSEMGAVELRGRLQGFTDVPPETWRGCQFWERSNSFADVIRADAINLIDYLELDDAFYRVAGMLRQIYEKLDKGVAIIALQQTPGAECGRGGSFSLEKPRLYLSLNRHPEHGQVVKITKAKNWRNHSRNPNGFAKRFSIRQGCILGDESPWERNTN